MQRSTCVFLLILAFFPVSALAQRDAWIRHSSEPIALPSGSRVEFVTMTSEAVGGEASYSVFLPPTYGSGDAKYPVVYFLHGLFNDHTSWTIDRHGNIPELVDGLMAKKTLREMVLVFPDGGRSFYTNYRDGTLRYEDFIVEELPRHVEAGYRVSPGRTHRALAGTSMGGYGALKIAIRHPTRYAGAAAHSAIVFPVRNPLDVPEAARSARSYQYLGVVFRTIYGDPFDQEYFDANNPLELARKADLDGLAIYFDYGTADRYNRSVGLGAGNQKLAQALSKSGVDHVFHEHEGEPHGWALVYAHIPESLGFLAEHLAP